MFRKMSAWLTISDFVFNAFSSILLSWSFVPHFLFVITDVSQQQQQQKKETFQIREMKRIDDTERIGRRRMLSNFCPVSEHSRPIFLVSLFFSFCCYYCCSFRSNDWTDGTSVAKMQSVRPLISFGEMRRLKMWFLSVSSLRRRFLVPRFRLPSLSSWKFFCLRFFDSKPFGFMCSLCCVPGWAKVSDQISRVHCKNCTLWFRHPADSTVLCVLLQTFLENLNHTRKKAEKDQMTRNPCSLFIRQESGWG